jgi:hypothetical protein
MSVSLAAVGAAQKYTPPRFVNPELDGRYLFTGFGGLLGVGLRRVDPYFIFFSLVTLNWGVA